MENGTFENMTNIVSLANETTTKVVDTSNLIDPFWFWAAIGTLAICFIVVVIWFLGETFILRMKMFGRKSHGVIEIIERNGRRTLHAKKFEREVIVDKYLFRPNYDQEHLFRNEYGMPTVIFNVRSVENVPIENTGKIEVPEDCQVKANRPPMVMTDPAEDLQSHTAFLQAGLLRGMEITKTVDLLKILIFIILIMCSVGTVATIYGFFKLGVFA